MNKIYFTLLLSIFAIQSFAQPTVAYEESSNEYSANGWGFSLSDLQSALQSWIKYPIVKVDTFGYSVGGRPMYRVSILKNGTITDQKYRVAIHARTHPAEVQSSLVTNEMIHILLSNSALAQRLLDSCIFNIVPMYNVDGVELGLARTNINGADIEGDWSLTTPEKEVANLRALYKTYMESKIPVRIALNMHSALACKRYFVFHSEVGTSLKYTLDEKKFLGAIRNYWPEGIENWDYNITWTTSTPKVYPESWFWLNYKESVMALTYEDMNCTTNGEYDKTANAILSGMSDYLELSQFTGLKEMNTLASENEISIYPNPLKTGEKLKINIQQSVNDNFILSVFDLNGRIVYQQRVHTNSFEVLLPNQLKGLYFVKLQGSKLMFNSKLVIE